MKKIMVIIVIGLLLVAVLTVPKQTDFTEWVTEDLKNETHSELASWGVGLVAKPIVIQMSTCSNYVLFSVCEMKFTEENRVKAVGVFNRFIKVRSFNQE